MIADPQCRTGWDVCALYRFADLADCDLWRQRLEEACKAEAVLGTLILAPEGINGTIAARSAPDEDGRRRGVHAIVALLQSDPRFADAEIKYATASEPPFKRLKVRVKPEIVTFGHAVDPGIEAATPVAPAEWDALIGDPNVTLVDVRNDFEVAMGTFSGALDPRTREFRQWPAWAEANLPADRDAPVAMFCTGGIRCEKSSSWLRQRGYRNLYQLDGGILRYLEDMQPGDTEETKWQGACFVFDERVGVGPGLKRTDHVVCRSCRTPLSPADRAHEDYHVEVSCPHCAPSLRPADRARRLERRAQSASAAAQGIAHVGADLEAERARKRAARKAQRDRSLSSN